MYSVKYKHERKYFLNCSFSSGKRKRRYQKVGKTVGRYKKGCRFYESCHLRENFYDG